MRGRSLNSQLGHNLISLKTIDSTNLYCVRNLQSLPSGTVVVAENQTNGRGRNGRHWHSPKGKNLYTSILIHTQPTSQLTMFVSQAASLAVYSTVIDFNLNDVWIKWPNDIYINQFKVAGILSECHKLQTDSLAIIIGIGVNLNMRQEELKQIDKPAESLGSILNKKIDVNHFLQQLINQLDELFHEIETNGPDRIYTLWKSASPIIGKTVNVFISSAERVTGTVIDLAYDGGILMQLASGEKTKFLAGDVSLAYEPK